MKFIIGKKLNMGQVYGEDGSVVPVTMIKTSPCVVTQVKTEKKDGYNAIQVGFGSRKKINKPLAGHLKKLGQFRHLKEFSVEENQEIKTGDLIDIDSFSLGDKVAASGNSKGRGFQGVVKRHGFAGSPASHGHKDQLRMPGSIGSTGPARVFKGTRMGGRMGGQSVTVTNLEIVEVDKDNEILAIKGAVPGARGGLIFIKGEGELKFISKDVQEEQKQGEAQALEGVDSKEKNKKTDNGSEK